MERPASEVKVVGSKATSSISSPESRTPSAEVCPGWKALMAKGAMRLGEVVVLSAEAGDATGTVAASEARRVVASASARKIIFMPGG